MIELGAGPRLLVVAGAWDDVARDFVARHEPSGAALLVPRDLSRRGWHFRLGDPAASVVLTGSRRFRLREVGGVLIRLAAVTEADLPHIVADDRAYVAAELTAFLLALLTTADIPVVNRPTPQCLCGPAWRDEKWRRVAHRLGIPVRQVHRHVTLGSESANVEPAGATAVIVGADCIAAGDPALAAMARAIATEAGADLLTVEFDGPGPTARVLRASPLVALDDPRVESAVLGMFGMSGRRAMADADDPALGH